MKKVKCTNLSIDLTRGEIIATFDDDSTFNFKTDLYTIADFDLVRGTAKRIENHIKHHFSHHNSRPVKALNHLKTTCYHNNGLQRKQQF